MSSISTALESINTFLTSTTGVVAYNLVAYTIAKAHNSDTEWEPYRTKIETALGITTTSDSDSES